MIKIDEDLNVVFAQFSGASSERLMLVSERMRVARSNCLMTWKARPGLTVDGQRGLDVLLAQRRILWALGDALAALWAEPRWESAGAAARPGFSMALRASAAEQEVRLLWSLRAVERSDAQRGYGWVSAEDRVVAATVTLSAFARWLGIEFCVRAIEQDSDWGPCPQSILLLRPAEPSTESSRGAGFDRSRAFGPLSRLGSDSGLGMIATCGVGQTFVVQPLVFAGSLGVAEASASVACGGVAVGNGGLRPGPLLAPEEVADVWRALGRVDVWPAGVAAEGVSVRDVIQRAMPIGYSGQGPTHGAADQHEDLWGRRRNVGSAAEGRQGLFGWTYHEMAEWMRRWFWSEL